MAEYMPEAKKLMSEVKDMTEITRLLRDTVNQQNNDKDKNERKQENSCCVNSVDINKMDELIKTHVKSDQHDKDEGFHESSENCKLEQVKNISEVRKTEDNQSNTSDSYKECDDNYDECYGDQSLDDRNSSSEGSSFKRTMIQWFKRDTKVKYKYKDKYEFNLD